MFDIPVGLFKVIALTEYPCLSEWRWDTRRGPKSRPKFRPVRPMYRPG